MMTITSLLSSPIIFALAATFSTFAGGLFALRLKKFLPLIMGFTGGVLLGVVFFDIFPEIFEKLAATNNEPLPVMIAVVSAIIFFHILEKSILIHSHQEEVYAHHHHPHVGLISALILVGHSLMDGFIIGLGFQASEHVGVLLAIAVISHDFTDGMNTVTLMLKSGNTNRKSSLLLVLDAIAPLLGAFIATWFVIHAQVLTILLGVFAGSLLYIALADILPSAHRDKSSYKLIALTICGAILILWVNQTVANS